jgi:hypothetical protein
MQVAASALEEFGAPHNICVRGMAALPGAVHGCWLWIKMNAQAL